jgi:hypothetical protein
VGNRDSGKKYCGEPVETKHDPCSSETVCQYMASAEAICLK